MLCRYVSMKLYTDKYNPFSLRVLVADNLAGTAVTVQHVRNDGMFMNYGGLSFNFDKPKGPYIEFQKTELMVENILIPAIRSDLLLLHHLPVVFH